MKPLKMIYRSLVLSAGLVLLMASPVSGQQLIDATEEGGEAFVAFTIMVVLFTASLFFLDRIRKRLQQDEEPEDDS